MRYELTDFEWVAIQPFLPNKPRGTPRVDDRRVLNGIFWVSRSDAPGRDLPETCGPRGSRIRELACQQGAWEDDIEFAEIATGLDFRRLNNFSSTRRSNPFGEMAEYGEPKRQVQL